MNTSKIANIWKGIRSLMKIKLSSTKDILILDDNGKLETDPLTISNIFNKKFVSMGPMIDEKIAPGKLHYSDYLKDTRINNTFFLLPATYKETSNIILHLDLNKALGPNSLPTFILKLCTEFFATYVASNLPCPRHGAGKDIWDFGGFPCGHLTELTYVCFAVLYLPTGEFGVSQ